jgi:hypothetical protein
MIELDALAPLESANLQRAERINNGARFNSLFVQFDRKLSTIQFFLNGNFVYDIGLELCQSADQIAQWLFQLEQKRWIKENNGLALFLQVLNDVNPASVEMMRDVQILEGWKR